MGNKQQQVVSIVPAISQNLPVQTTIDTLNHLPNEILFCIFDYLLPLDIVRAFKYDLQRFDELIKRYIVTHGINFIKIKSNDFDLIPICLSLIEQQHLSICTKDCLLSTVLKSIPSPNTLTVIINTTFEQSFLSKIQLNSIICKKLIVEYTPDYHHQMYDNDLIPLLSSSVHTLILRNIIFLFNQSIISYICNSLYHIRCILKNENDLHKLLIQFPALISIDIQLISHELSKLSTELPVPKHFRIEYPNGTILNFDKFPHGTKSYDQTVYSLPWIETNFSLVLRSCHLQNYLNRFPHPLPCIRQLTIECTSEPWSFQFVTFLRQTFPNIRTLYATQKYDNSGPIMTSITRNDRKNGRCTLYRPHNAI